jgi:hypothetical protein
VTTPAPSITTDEYALDVLVDDVAEAVQTVAGRRIEVEVDTTLISARTQEQVGLDFVTDLVIGGGGGGVGGGISDSEKVYILAAVTWNGTGTAPARPPGYGNVIWRFPADRNPVLFVDWRDGDYWEFVQTEEASI